jgi:hypothetical protein
MFGRKRKHKHVPDDGLKNAVRQRQERIMARLAALEAEARVTGIGRGGS